jgi:hypothetical protein
VPLTLTPARVTGRVTPSAGRANFRHIRHPPGEELAGESTTSEMGKPSLAVWTGSRRHRLDPISAAQRAGVARLH